MHGPSWELVLEPRIRRSRQLIIEPSAQIEGSLPPLEKYNLELLARVRH